MTNLVRRQAEIEQLLRSYGIPQLSLATRSDTIAEN